MLHRIDHHSMNPTNLYGLIHNFSLTCSPLSRRDITLSVMSRRVIMVGAGKPHEPPRSRPFAMVEGPYKSHKEERPD
jgi:hypothetical protein